MDDVAYCTTDDVRRALREEELPGDAVQDPQIVVGAITAQTEWAEKTLDRHWYEPDGISEATEVTIPTAPKTRDDEHDIPTHAGMVHGAAEDKRRRRSKNSDALLESGPRYERRRRHWQDPKQQIQIAFGEEYDPRYTDPDRPIYTRITFDRRDVQNLNALHVVNEQNGFDDWVASDDYSGGVGNQYRGDDYWVRINNGGRSELYLNVHAMDDDIPSFSNAVYVDIDYGHEGMPSTFRRAVAFRAASDLAEDAAMQIPNNATVYNVESLAEQFERKAEELLEVYQPDG